MCHILHFWDNIVRQYRIVLMLCWGICFLMPEVNGQDPCNPDIIPPTLVVSLNKSYDLDVDGNITVYPADFVVSIADNCGADISGVKFVVNVTDEESISYDCDNIGNNQAKIVAVDLQGNRSVEQDVTIIINDKEPPELDVVSPQDVYLDNAGNLIIFPINYVVSVTDNCTPVNNITILFHDGTDQTSLSYTCADIGQTKTLTVVAIDQKGNRTEKATSITIKDVSPPIFYILAGSYYADLDGSGNMTISPDTYVTNQSDNCTAAGNIKFRFFDGSEHIGQTLSCNDIGPKILSILAFDESGNRSATQDVVISVRDNTAPTFDIVLGQVIAVGTNGRITVFPGSFVTNGADNCTASTDIEYYFFDGTDHTSLEYACSDIGPKTVSIVAVDQAGNRSTKTATFTIGDQTAPIFDVVAGIQDVFLGEDGSITISPDPFILNPSDNCTAVTDITFLFVDGTEKTDLTYTCADLGQKTLTIVAYDAANNRSVEKNVDIHIKDNTPPVIDCTSPVVYPNGQYFPTNSATQCTYKGSFKAPLATDNCTPAGLLTKTYVITNGDYPPIYGSSNIADVQFPIGTNTVSYTITDQNGNSSTCSFTVEVKDGDPPVITCPSVTYPSGGTYFPTDPDVCVSRQSFAAPVAADNCTPTDQLVKTFEIVTVNGIVTGTGDIVDYGFPAGTNTVTYTVADAAGNTTVCPFSVVVKDDQAPVAICQDISVTLGILSGERTITVSEIDNGSRDNCGITQMSLDIDKFTCTDLGNNTVTLTVMDAAGNSATCTATVLVQYDPSLDPQAIFRQQEICSNSNAVLDLTNPGFETVTDWGWSVTVPAGITPATGLNGTAQGDRTITQPFDNSTDAVENVTYLVTPKLYGGACALTAIRAEVSVNPRLKLLAMSDTSICDNTSTRKIIRTSSSVSTSAKVYYGWTITNNPNVDGETNSVSEQIISSLLDQTLDNRTAISQEVVYTLTPSLHLLGDVCSYPGYDQQLKVTIEPTPVIRVLADNDTVCNNTTIVFTVDSLNNPAGRWQYTLSTNIQSDDNASPDVSNRVGRQHDSFTQILHNEATRWHWMRYTFSPQIITKQGHTCFAPSRNDTLVTIRVNPTPLLNITKFQDSICYKDDGPEIRMTSNNGDVLGTLRYNLWQVDYAGNTVVENVATTGMMDFAGRAAAIDQTTLWNKSNTEQTVVYYIYPFIEYRNALHCSGDSIEQKIYLASELVFDMVESVYPGGRNVKCYNASDGKIEVKNQNGGWSAKGYDYEWSGYTDAGNTPVITNRPAATYGVTVRDKVIGCQTHKEVTLTQPDLLKFLNPSIARPDCNGPTGSIMVHATGGTRNDTLQYEYKCFLTEAPLLYSYTGADSSFTNLKSGKYTVMVVDTNQCLATVEYELPYYPGNTVYYPNWNESKYKLDASSGVIYNITCHGANDGSMNPSANSISGYTWKYNGVVFKKDTVAPGDPLFQFVPKGGDFYMTNLKPGYYDLTLFDDRGCAYTTERQWITEPPEVTFNVDVPKYPNNYEVKCDGAKDGQIFVSDVAGGYGMYDYIWSASPDIVPGAAEQTALGAGIYTLTIRSEYDQGHCDTTIIRTLNEPPALLVAETISNHNGYEIQCYGEHTGSINLNVSGGGSGGYTYQWTTADGSGLIPQAKDQNALSAGTYTVDIGYSGDLCTQTKQYILHSPSRIQNDSIVSGIKCHGGSNASVQINISGGVPTYSYRWSSPDVTVANPNAKDQTGLAPGTYWLVITDGNGCVKMETYSLLEPAPVSPNLDAEDMSCDPGNDGYITANPLGGTPGYTFLWSNGSTAPGITGLLPGTYSVTVTDLNGCTGTANAAIKEPLPLTVTAAVTTDFNGYSIDCYGNNSGKIGLTIENGRGAYTYLWSSGAVTDRIDQATAGNYSVIVTDKFKCSGNASITLTQPDRLWGQPTTNNIACPGGNNGNIQALVGGGVMPYRYQWSNGYGDSPIAGNLAAGTYEVRVTDKNNCHLDLQATLTQPPAFKVDFTLTDAFCPETSDGDIRAVVSGGTPPYQYLWQGISGATGIGITDVRAGAYTFEITDAANCTYTQTIELGYASDECLRIPNAFSPNNDGSNDRWEITIGDRNSSVRYPLRDLYPEAVVSVFSANWGMLLYRSQKGYPEPWDGKYRGKYLPVNSYVYIIQLNKDAKPITGNVTIIR